MSEYWVLLCFLALLFVAIMILARTKNMARQPIAGGAQRHHKTVVKDLATNPRTKSEALAIGMLKDATGLDFPTVNPAWLVWGGRTRELDGYNEKAKLALEFSGPLHTKWFPGTEPYEKYFSRIVVDVAKRKLCARHGVDLIIIDMSLPRIHWKSYIQSRLYDFGRIPDRPWNYVDAQSPKPYRNKQLEGEIGLREEWKAVNRL